MDKPSELKAVESQWKTLDDSSIIRDVLFKGKFISNALKFISERSNISIDDTKLIFFEVTGNIVKLLVQNKQLHRAVHVLKNAQLNETHYLYDLAQESGDKSVCSVIMDFLKKSTVDFDTNEKIVKANHICFKLLTLNIQKHLKYLDNINRNHDNFVITPYNIKNPNIIFGTFMKQKQSWRNEITVDVFFKSKRDPEILFLLPILEKDSFFGYVIQNELYGLLKRWINEQYLSRAGKAIQSTINEPTSFDEALNHLFREWKFDQTMMDRISRREKDVIKNEFAKLGLFESREAKCVNRKLNRLFTTHTFNENFHLAIGSEELTKFIIENKLVGLLNEKFIDHNYIRSVLDSNSQVLRDELTLLEAMKNLLSKETTVEEFVKISKITTSYIKKYDKSFDENRTDLVLVEGILENDLQNFKQLAERNSFLRNLYEKLTTPEELPSIEFLLEKFHSINMDYICEEFSDDIPSFDDPQMSSTYGETFSLSYLDYVQQYQGVYATYKFIMEMIKNSMTISRPQIMSGCEEVAKLATENFQNEKLVAHAVAFNECFDVDTKNLRRLLKLLRLKRNDEGGFEKFLNSTIQAGSSEEDIKLVEALETFWSVQKYEVPTRGYLDPFLNTDDWFRFVLLAQYFNYPLESFVMICETRIKNKTLADNLIRAVSFDVPNTKRPDNFSKLHRSKVSVPEAALNLFKNGKFLDKKHDLFAILFKCNETISRVDLSFDEFQRFFLRDKSDEVDDLLFQAVKYNWPILAVLAATTTLYRIKYCFLTWLILSSEFKLVKKMENLEELSISVFEHCVKIGFIRTLHESAQVFYPESSFFLFTKFLFNTKNGDFTDLESLLKMFIVKLSEDDFKMVVIKGKEKILSFIFNCLILHLQLNIKFGLQQEQYLECIDKSEIAIFVRKFDFGLLKQISKFLEKTSTRINYQTFCDGEKKSSKEIERILEELIQSDHFEEAVAIAELMKIPKSDFVIKIWRHMYEKEDQKHTSFEIEKYLSYVDSFKLKMDDFIKFLSSIVDEMIDCVVKYNMMVFILKNSRSGSDSLEYDVIYLYIRLKSENLENIEPLTSKYYQETICSRKNLIHESLYELKSIAKIDDISISFKSLKDKREIEELEKLIFHLLDLNDMVQVLRIQEMFGHATDDLKIIVYMLSVCEGLTSIYDISKQERQEISSYVSGQMTNMFHRFTLRALRTTSTTDLNESIVANDSSRFQENKETFQALQGLVSKIKHGIKYGQRIVLVYRASLFLNRSFKELMKIENSFEFLELATSCDGENRLLVMSDIIDAMVMTDIEVAEFISKEIVACIIRTRFIQFNTELMSASSASLSRSNKFFDEIWGFSLSKDLHLIFELCKGKTTLLGNYLLKYYKILSQSVADIPIHHAEDKELEKLCQLLNQTMSHQIMSQKKQNIIRVEILIVAHDCFCQECSTEGIATILNLTKNLVNTLADKKSFNLIVRLLCGIGRFREMFYVFDILIKNEVFEALLGQFSEKQANGLKNAILCYLNENHPNNKEYFKMAAAHFSMYTELANHSRSSAMEKLQKVIGESQVKRLKSGRITTNQAQQVEIPYLKCNSKNVTVTLQDALNDMMHATEMVIIDNKIEMSLKFAALCELIAMQIHLVKLGEESEEKLCPCVINFEQHAEKFQYFANYELSVPQTIILNKNIESSIDYSKSIFIRSIVNGDTSYLSDYTGRFNLTDEMIENLVKLAQLESIEQRQEKVLHDLVMKIRNCDLKFKLASLLGLKGILQEMLNDEQIYYYLLDTKYGSVDIF